MNSGHRAKLSTKRCQNIFMLVIISVKGKKTDSEWWRFPECVSVIGNHRFPESIDRLSRNQRMEVVADTTNIASNQV